MAGACVGFLLHNRYKASIFMGETGSLALGAALAAMAACTGMFFPLFVSSGIFILEASLVIMQVSHVVERLFYSWPVVFCGFSYSNVFYTISFSNYDKTTNLHLVLDCYVFLLVLLTEAFSVVAVSFLGNL